MFKKSYKWAIVGGLFAQILFTLSWLVAGLFQGEGYDWKAHTISDMYADGAPYGEFLIAALVVSGVLTITFALFGLWPKIRESGWGATVGSILLAISIFGLGDALAMFERLGCRLADAGCTPELQTATSGGMLDSMLSGIGIACFSAAVIFIGIAFNKSIKWKKYAVPTLLLGGIMIAVLFAQGAVPNEYIGLVERMIALTGALTISFFAVILLPTKHR